MNDNDLSAHLIARLHAVQRNLGFEPAAAARSEDRFSDALDSMGMVEFLALVAEDCGVKPDVIESAVGHQFGTVAELAAAMSREAILPRGHSGPVSSPAGSANSQGGTVWSWLAATAVRLGDTAEPASAIDRALHRPEGWFESHAGIQQRRVWKEQDPLAAATAAGREALECAGVNPSQVASLLVASEAPPLLLGLAAALHHRLELPPRAVAVEVGGACTGFLAALWTAQGLLTRHEIILVLSVEAATRFLRVEPGAAGEAAALFGDAAAATVLCGSPLGANAVPLAEIVLASDGSLASILQIEQSRSSGIEIRMRGTELAGRAIHVMAESVGELASRHGLDVRDLAGVVAHGGNGRMPALLALKLGLPAERVWSETSVTGNLGSASLPVAWAAHKAPPQGAVIWTAVGAGLTWGAALSL